MREKEFKVSTVKNKVLFGALAVCVAFACMLLAGCSSNSGESESSDSGESINVVSREDGSGTRGAFVELFGVEQEDENGETVDMTTESASITNSTAVMMTTVAGDANAIGYISLGSLDDSVKAVKIDGAEATVDNVKSGDYKVSRPFNVVTNSNTELSDVAQDFMNFILSSDGQAVVAEEGYIPLDGGEAYTASNLSGTVTVAGSSSVTPVMEKLAEAYQALNPDVTIEVNQSDSTTGVTSAIEGACDLGMASRDLKDSETSEGAQATVIATDGIAVIVNPESAVEDLTSDQVKQIFTGEITSWSEIG
jgi:phosphate transport system substrate-binding protein